MRIGSLFSGYSGLDMGVQAVLGGTVAWHCDNDPGASKILAHHWPDTPNLGDITAVDWTTVEPVDVVTGGFPCQDISSSGRKAGIDAGGRSGLWREYARAIGVLRPRLVVVENVRDITFRGLDRVAGDLAELRYDAQWTTVSACAVGAPFARVRLFLIAAPAGTNRSGLRWVPQRDSLPKQTSALRLKWQQQHADRLALADQRALDRWAELLGRPAPNPLDRGRNRQPRLTPVFVEWLMGLPDGHVTAVPGLSRNDQLKALGNGVVPQQATAAIRLLDHLARAAA